VSEDDDDPVRSVEVVSDEDDEEVAEPVESGLEPELMVSEPDVPGRLELAPEPAPEPMLPEVVSPLGEVDERLLSRFDLVDLSDHFVNSDCDSEPSLLESAVLNAPLSSTGALARRAAAALSGGVALARTALCIRGRGHHGGGDGADHC
jgi:hypothetical protein